MTEKSTTERFTQYLCEKYVRPTLFHLKVFANVVLPTCLGPPKKTILFFKSSVITALRYLASIVTTLCDGAEMAVPAWAAKRFGLPAPWFVSEMESLKAMALLESPLAFRKNNIFVHSNFMERA